MNKYTWLIASIVLYAASAAAFAQSADEQVLEDAAAAIKKKNIGLSEEQLARDRALIKKAYPQIKDALSMNGFNDAEVNQAVAAGWKSFRLQPSSVGSLNEQVFRAQISRLGMLRIESEPSAATIEINRNLHDERTNTAAWLAPGTYRIVLMKG